MKKNLIISIVVIMIWAGIISVSAETNFFISETAHYKVYTDESMAFSQEVSDKMEASFILFNDLLHFDTSTLHVKLKVRIFKTKELFDKYLLSLLDETRGDFVYIHYSDLERSELVGFKKEKIEDFDSSLLHQGFIQFVKAFIPATPIWLREGTAAYFEASTYDPKTKSFTWKPNLVWLDSLKGIIKGENNIELISIDRLLLMDRDAAVKYIDIFYPESWGLVHFLINSNEKKYNRVFWDTLSTLRPNNTLEENAKLVVKRAFSWIPYSIMEKDFKAYIMSLKTPYDFVKEGIDLYSKNRLEEAKKSFENAIKLDSEINIPYYYLGLIYYSERKYDDAEEYYKKSLEKGTDKALINYALGVNAFAANRFDDATAYLKKAKELDEKTYGAKVDSLLKRIDLLK